MNELISMLYTRVCRWWGGTRSRAMVEGLRKLGGMPLAACICDNPRSKPSNRCATLEYIINPSVALCNICNTYVSSI
jgi:hypothetical protein